jgi:hypothetical protein
MDQDETPEGSRLYHVAIYASTLTCFLLFMYGGIWYSLLFFATLGLMGTVYGRFLAEQEASTSTFSTSDNVV